MKLVNGFNREIYIILVSLVSILIKISPISAVSTSRITPVLRPLRMASGLNATQGQFPFFAWVRPGGPKSERFCGGAIIDNRYVLTLASCIKDRQTDENFRVSFGHVKRKDDSALTINVTHTCVSSLYEKFADNWYHDDFALLRLAKPLNFTSNINQVPFKGNSHLDKSSYWFSKATCYAVGSGYYDPTHALGDLKYNQVSFRGCIKNKHDSLVCYVYLSKPIGVSCKGDLGGPIVCHEKDDDKMLYLVGLIGSAAKQCRPYEAAANLCEATFIQRFRNTTLDDCLNWFNWIT